MATKKSKQGGVKGMHNGHTYKETCMCAMCKRIRKKNGETNAETNVEPNVEPVETKEKIISDYLNNLSDDELFFVIPEETSQMLINNIDKLKNKYQGKPYREFMQDVINDSLFYYLEHAL